MDIRYGDTTFFYRHIFTLFNSKKFFNVIVFVLYLIGDSSYAACPSIGTSGTDSVNCTGTYVNLDYSAGGNDEITIENEGSATTISGNITFGSGINYLQIYGNMFNAYSIKLGTPTNSSNVYMGGGDDTVTYYNYKPGNIIEHYGDLFLDDGNDRYGITNNTHIIGNVFGGIGNDSISIGANPWGYPGPGMNSDLPIFDGDINGGDGDDIFRVYYKGTLNGSVIGGIGNDNLLVNNATLTGGINMGEGDDTVSIQNNSSVTVFDFFETGSGNDNIYIYGGNVTATEINSGDGDDSNYIYGGVVTGTVNLGSGADLGTIYDGSLNGDFLLGDGDDAFDFYGGIISGDLYLGTGINSGSGSNLLSMYGGYITGSVYGGTDDDSVIINGGVITGSVNSGDGRDNIKLQTGHILGDVNWGGGDDYGTSVGDTQVDGDLIMGDGDDKFEMVAGTVNNLYLGTGLNSGVGSDNFTMTGGAILGGVYGGTGDDILTLSGGNIETLVSTGGGKDVLTVNGDLDVPVMDGGENVDILNLEHRNTIIQSDKVINWEVINLNNSTATLLGDILSAGHDIDQGVYLNSSLLTVNAPININANLTIDPVSQLIHQGGRINGNVTNSGLIKWGELGQNLMIDGNYTGNGGVLELDSQLFDDTSTTDSFTITGYSAGVTTIRVNNIGGLGAQTIEGIKLVQVNGQSDGIFVQNGRIVAGAYDYNIVRGKDPNTYNNWYLASRLTNVTNVPTSVVTPTDSIPTIRPEVGSYTHNIAVANTMFMTRLYDRVGETWYTDLFTGEKKVTSIWLRQVGGHNEWFTSDSQLKTQGNRYVVQLGGDIFDGTTSEIGQFRVGVMAGYGNDSNRTNSYLTSYRSSGNVEGYSLGVYGTWYQNSIDATGLYLDGWAQYNWFDNRVVGQDLTTEIYKSKGVTTSVESGYKIKIRTDDYTNQQTREWFVQPQAQIVFMNVSADDHTEVNGTRVFGNGSGNVMVRLGARSYVNYYDDSHAKDRYEFQPYIEGNFIHNTKQFGVNMNDVMLQQSGTKNIGEIRFGVEGEINQSLTIWGNIGVQFSSHGYEDNAALLGIRYVID